MLIEIFTWINGRCFVCDVLCSSDLEKACFKFLFKAADILAVRQKRRIYDITNVLEGIGLIEKKSKNSIQWKYVYILAT